MSTADERPRSEAIEASEGMSAQGLTPPSEASSRNGSIDLRERVRIAVPPWYPLLKQRERTPTMTTQTTSTETKIQGRFYTVTQTEARFESSWSVWGEVELHGRKGAEYISERYHNTNVLRFSGLGRRGLPVQKFDGTAFVLEGDELRLATIAEWKAAYATAVEASKARTR